MALIVVHKQGRFESREKDYCGHTASDRKDGSSPHNSQLLFQVVGLEDRPGLEDWQATSGSKVEAVDPSRCQLRRVQACLRQGGCALQTVGACMIPTISAQIMKCRASLHRNQAPHVQTTVALCRKMLTRQ
mmetsp:Transcript_15521/g.42868  ORF Transcript_15521/g.42868 Transcript_15521/m.42868 type:complete len:131 (+) Transcript_15521:675-1067(+)